MEFNAQQLLFEAFSHIMRIFGSVKPQTESPFPFQHNITFETYQPLKPLSFTLEGGRQVCHYFCIEFNAQQLLSEPFLDTMRIFGSIEPSSESTFLLFYIIIFRTYQSLYPPGSTRGGGGDGRHMRP